MKTVTKTSMKGYGGKGIILSPTGNSYKPCPAIAGDTFEDVFEEGDTVTASYVYTKAGATVYLTDNESGHTIATVRSDGTVDETNAAVEAALGF